MPTALHNEIVAVSADDPAVHISADVIVSVVTRRFQETIRQFVGHYQSFPGQNGPTQIGLLSCDYDAKSTTWQMLISPDGSSFDISSSQGFSAEFLICKYNDPAIRLSVVTLNVQHVYAHGTVDKNSLSISDPEIIFDSLVSRDQNFDQNVKLLQITELDVTRLEGLTEGAVAPTALQSALRKASPIDLRSLFPAISFDGRTELVQLRNGLLIIARDGWNLQEAARCACGAIAPPVWTNPGQPAPPAAGAPPTRAGSLPINIQYPPPKVPRPPLEDNIDPGVCIYLPKSAIRPLTSGPYPSISGYIEDNGFIGFSFSYSLAFRNVSFSLNDHRATLVVSLGFYLDGHGDITVDVPCVGRQTAGRTWATNRNRSSSIEIGVTPVLHANGKIELEGELLSLSVDPFDVDTVTVTGLLLSYFGPWGTIAGFVFDRILSVVVGQQLRSNLSEAIREAVGHQNWTLIDLTKFDTRALGLGPAYSVKSACSRLPDSLLVGFAANRG